MVFVGNFWQFRRGEPLADSGKRFGVDDAAVLAVERNRIVAFAQHRIQFGLPLRRNQNHRLLRRQRNENRTAGTAPLAEGAVLIGDADHPDAGQQHGGLPRFGHLHAGAVALGHLLVHRDVRGDIGGNDGDLIIRHQHLHQRRIGKGHRHGPLPLSGAVAQCRLDPDVGHKDVIVPRDGMRQLLAVGEADVLPAQGVAGNCRFRNILIGERPLRQFVAGGEIACRDHDGYFLFRIRLLLFEKQFAHNIDGGQSQNDRNHQRNDIFHLHPMPIVSEKQDLFSNVVPEYRFFKFFLPAVPTEKFRTKSGASNST